VNDAPTDSGLAGTTVAENVPAGTTIGMLSTTDVDAGDTFTYSLVSGTGDTDNAAFTIDGGTLKTTASFNFEAKSSYAVRIRSTDANGLSTEKAFTLTVADVNEAPTGVALANTTTSVAENTSTATRIKVADIIVTDDALGSLTITLTGTDAASFEVDGLALYLKSGVSLDFETQASYAVTVSVEDTSLTDSTPVTAGFTLTVTDVNEAPTDIGLAGTTVAENAPSGTTVGNFSTTDVDARDTFTYSLVSGTGDADNAAFAIDGSAVKTVASLNFEAKSSYSVRVRSTDRNGLSIEKTFAISVIDVSEAAIIGLPDPFANQVVEDTAVDGQGFLTTSGAFTVTDPDAGEAAFSTTAAAAPGAVNLGTLSIDAAGGYAYAVRNSLDAVQALRAGTTHEDRFVIQTVDGTSRTVSFVITGVADVLSGVVADGYLKHAVLFADSNGNGIRDWTDAGGANGAWDAGEGEAWTTTDDTGDFSFDFGDPTATLRSIGGTDLSTGLPFTGSLTAPAGSTVVNPLTTLVVATAAATPGATVATATAAVLAGLGLPAGIDLVSYDPLAQAAGDPTALQVQKAAASVANVIVVAVSAGIDSAVALSNLAGRVVAATPAAPVDLTNAAVLGSVLTVGSVPPPAARVAGLAAVNTAVSTAAALADIATSQGIVQAGLVPPTITSVATTTVTTGSAMSFQFVATGTPTATFSTTSALPSGVTLSTNGLLAGTPTVGSGGTYVLSVTASNGVLPTATQTFTLVVTDPNDITVSVVNNVVVLTLAPQGVAISNLSTSYISWNKQLTITAQTRGTGGAITGGGTGIRVNGRAGTITVDLTKLTGFAGISVVGTAATDAITIGRGGVNLAAIGAGAASQSFRIDTGAGVADVITVGSAISAKGSGVVTLTTLGEASGGGIQLGGTVTTASGSQTYVGNVTLVGDTTLSAGTGGSIQVSGRIDGARRLTLAAGGTITLGAGVGITTPLRGMTISRASGVAIAGGFRLNGSGTAAGTSGLTVAAGVNNLVFAPVDSVLNPRSITGFSGSGIRVLGGTTGSLLSGIASTGNRIGLEMLPGAYTGTVITNCDFSQNTTGGVSLTGTTNLTLGRATGGNTISRNAAWGILATGALTGSVVQNNTLDANGRAGMSLNAATGLLVGGLTANAGNRIINATAWGAFSVGIEATGKLTGTRLQGNLVSGNAGSGVVLTAAQGLTVGGPHPAARNVIQANLGNGLVATGACTGSLVQGNAISGNRAGDLNTRSARHLTVR